VIASERVASSARTFDVVIVLAGILSIAAGAITDSLALALVPFVALFFVWLCFGARLHAIGLAIFFLTIVADNPKERPAEGLWTSPLHPLGLALYENVNVLTGIEALRFSGADVLLVFALVVVMMRRSEWRIALPRPMNVSLAVVFCTLLWLEAWGLARGGDFKSSLWQFRQLLWLPGATWLFALTLRGRRDLRAIGKTIVLAAIVKVVLGAYFAWFVARERPDYVTTHSDTILFTMAIALAIAHWVERSTLRTTLLTVLLVGVVGLGITLNGRRLAYVTLAGSFLAMFALLPKGKLRTRLRRTFAWASVPGAVYLRLGWHDSTNAFFGPAHKISSLFEPTDRSSALRDIENYNLIQTWKHYPLLGSGFGHEYLELSKGDDIGKIFALYRYIGHDSVLWLCSVGGFVGFTAIWMILVVGVYFAARVHRCAAAPIDRVAAVTALSIVVAFLVQAYGDMGLQSWLGVFMLAMALAVVGQLTTSLRAWPGART